MNREPRAWGAIFDWDGVIIDSSSHHEESWNRLALEIGKSMPPGHFKLGFGRKNEYIIPEILRWSSDPSEIQRLSLRKETLYREIVREVGISPLPGVTEWLERLAMMKIPCAIGSSTHRINIETTLELTHIGKYFSSIVSAEDVSEGKPSPDVFLRAAEKISRVPGRCVVFEDAHVGIQAARNGGMKVVAVATTNTLAALGDADIAVVRLDELSVDQIDRLFD